MRDDSYFENRLETQIPLFGCRIDNLSLEEAAKRVETFIERGGTHRYFAVNVHKIVAFRRFPELRDIANRSDLVTADGQPIVWASKWFGKPLKGRVTGTDLMGRLIELAVEKQYRIYLLGARAEVVAKVVDYYRKQFPRLKLVGSRDGYWAPEEESTVVQSIRQARPDLLFVGISSPRKELFMDRYLKDLEVPFVMGVGGAFDVLAGETQRAPVWMQRVGLEWFWRVRQEPRRMFGRYLLDGLQFGLVLLRERFSCSPFVRTAHRRQV